ncbi:tetratricopeptide repeat protein [Listeria sp. FSL L7-1517]|uniref:tetratricopeptide repeat protein n=1 Tax=Listeria immobilis TaxID=2713502 RepID=UPI00164E6411|nr:tetratricopeptide repeat protein [Listeria immobilis]MBC6297303.1 tetratricopeptide repeat protein [Listeria immobilis]
MIRLLLQNGEYESARTKSLLKLQADPENAELNYFAAWAHDALGKESSAIPFYEKALHNGLSEIDRQEAYVGLGSTYRITGSPEKAAALFQKALLEFPENKALQTFFIMTKYSQGLAKEALEDALMLLTETTENKDILNYKKAIQFYAKDLDALFH